MCLGVGGPGGAGSDETDANADVRSRFSAAYRAATFDADDEILRAYVLYPYLQAVRIERGLAGPPPVRETADNAAAAFLAGHGSAPVARALRRVWLASLAGRAQWPEFLEHYDSAVATSALECEHLNARIAVGDVAGLAPAIVERWLAPYRLPPECESAFQWLRGQGALSEALVLERATLLLDAGEARFARVIARRLPAEATAAVLERADFIEDPARMLDALVADPGREVADEVVLGAWTRLARNDPVRALARFETLAARSGEPEQASRLARARALGLAGDRRPEAGAYFARVAPEDLDDYALEWRTRAALWAGDWDTARAAIAAMAPERRAESAWRYWAARSAEKTGDRDGARALYAAVAADDNYYSAMAGARLGDRVLPRFEPLPVDAAAAEAIASMPPFVRARELELAGLPDLARLEWRFGYAALAEDLKPQTIHLAASAAMYDVAVATASSHAVFNDYALLYPRPHAEHVAAAARATGIDTPVLYGLLRQESLFRADAASGAGAIGIAQLRHETARATARGWHWPAPSRAELFDVPLNVTLGAAHLADLLDEFDGQLPLALAAYNAGPNAARRWLPDRPVDADVWIENIPYNETRAYVRRVLWHSLVFRWLEADRPQSARAWLDEIEPL